MIADDDLILSAALHNRDNTIHRLEHFVVGLSFILERETKSRNAVDKSCYIFLSADIFYNVFGQPIILSHVLPPVSISVFLCGNTKIIHIFTEYNVQNAFRSIGSK